MAYKLIRETEMTVADMGLVLYAAAAAALEIEEEQRKKRKRSEKTIASKKKKKVKDRLKRRVKPSRFFSPFYYIFWGKFSCVGKLDVGLLDDADVPSTPFPQPPLPHYIIHLM